MISLPSLVFPVGEVEMSLGSKSCRVRGAQGWGRRRGCPGGKTQEEVGHYKPR